MWCGVEWESAVRESGGRMAESGESALFGSLAIGASCTWAISLLEPFIYLSLT